MILQQFLAIKLTIISYIITLVSLSGYTDASNTYFV